MAKPLGSRPESSCASALPPCQACFSVIHGQYGRRQRNFNCRSSDTTTLDSLLNEQVNVEEKKRFPAHGGSRDAEGVDTLMHEGAHERRLKPRHGREGGLALPCSLFPASHCADFSRTGFPIVAQLFPPRGLALPPLQLESLPVKDREVRPCDRTRRDRGRERRALQPWHGTVGWSPALLCGA
ncbi:hypothetical protein H920_14156 [Fukomys damarensis]|uniref:Uncharacterized protein n=1 Tax=Fukomys damarensis TaxID=885580 RepID=A0A091D2L1_FUKDA|nr:hypothetical protein H920_14156 [Fukomys damarensis]